MTGIPDHELSRVSIVELQKDPPIKGLYERYFKNNPELINPRSIVNVVSSSLLGYDNNTGAVRDSIADVRKKNRVPTIPSLQVTKDNEFDRILLLVFHRFLADKGIPEEFLKSNYFTLRPQLLQVYQEDLGFDFRARLEEIIDDVEKQIVRDYKMLVNETNRTYLSRYPFEDMVRTIVPSDRRYSASKTKLEQIKQRSLTIPGATQKFSGLQQLCETYTKTSESNSSMFSISCVDCKRR